jgi:hypothetical protein
MPCSLVDEALKPVSNLVLAVLPHELCNGLPLQIEQIELLGEVRPIWSKQQPLQGIFMPLRRVQPGEGANVSGMWIQEEA